MTGPFDLVTTQTTSAKPLDGTAELDTRTTKNAYNISTDNSGWILGTPLQTTIDPGTSPHLNLTTTTLYDTTTGQMTERRLPANPSGGDAHATKFIAYTADGSSPDSACRSKPEWATLPCKQFPAAQPGTAGLPNLHTTQVTKYNMYQQPETSVDTNGSDNRTTTLGYDAAGRSTTNSVTSTIGTSIPQVTGAYDTSTGLPTTTGDGTRTITRGYDALGRPISYQDADSNTTNYTYDLLDRVSTVNDGKATTTYTYNDVGAEKRGLPTTISDTAVGTFTATYDKDGQLATQTYPGGLAATYTYDEAGEPTNLVYAKSSGFWPASPTSYNIHGQQTKTAGLFQSSSYGYDAAGRLTQAMTGELSGCTKRNYTYDADTNRTQLATTQPSEQSEGCPPTGSTTTTNYTYDASDRLTDTGNTYDAFGRTTATPAGQSPNGNATTLGYYVNDRVNTIASNGTTLTYNLDPNRRVRTWSSSADSQTHTNHYTDDSDSPAWISENTAGTTWNRYVGAFSGMAATQTNSGTISLQLTNLHGDISAQATTTDTSWTSGNTPTDEYGNGTNRYDYLGSTQVQRDTNSDLQLMGARVYNANTGRFLQTDPVAGGSANSYDYVYGDPINMTDLAGLGPCPPGQQVQTPGRNLPGNKQGCAPLIRQHQPYKDYCNFARCAIVIGRDATFSLGVILWNNASMGCNGQCGFSKIVDQIICPQAGNFPGCRSLFVAANRGGRDLGDVLGNAKNNHGCFSLRADFAWTWNGLHVRLYFHADFGSWCKNEYLKPR